MSPNGITMDFGDRDFGDSNRNPKIRVYGDSYRFNCNYGDGLLNALNRIMSLWWADYG